MKTSEQMSAFLRDGITRYAAARDAVETFEREVQSRLLTILEEKGDWRSFQPLQGERGRGEARASGTWHGVGGRSIYAYQRSALHDDGWVDLKLWWGSPRAPEGVLLCCGRYESNYKLRKIELADPRGEVVCRPVDGRLPHLYIAFTENSDLEAAGRLLLDEMDRALSGNIVG